MNDHILSRSVSIIEAFLDSTGCDHPGRHILDAASHLASHHQRQWDAEDDCRAPDASAEDIAASKRLIDDLNAGRVALVEQIDRWVGREIHSRADASLHTETLTSVVDRLVHDVAAHLVGTVDSWGSMQQGIAVGDFARWWFTSSTTAEHVGLMLGSSAWHRRHGDWIIAN